MISKKEEKELKEEFLKIQEKEKQERENITWTEAQEKLIGEMISASEDIGWTQGWDEANKENIRELETFIFNLKSKIYRKEK